MDRQQTNHMEYQVYFDSLKKGLYLELFAVAVFCGVLRVYFSGNTTYEKRTFCTGFSFVISFISVYLVRGGGTYGELYNFAVNYYPR